MVTLGVAGRGGEMLCAGQYWGEDMIVTSLSLRDTRNTTAIVYLELMSLTIGQLEEVLSASGLQASALEPVKLKRMGRG